MSAANLWMIVSLPVVRSMSEITSYVWPNVV